MRAIRALLRKELLQIRGLFLWMLGFTLFIVWIYKILLERSDAIVSYLTLNSLYATPVLIFLAFIFAQKIIVREYYEQTQRFIETLPIRPSVFALVKFSVGFLSLLFLALVVWMITVNLARNHEIISAQFLGLMLLRIVTFVFVLWSIVSTFSLLGRLRIPLLAICILVVTIINTYTSFELNQFGPFALMSQDLFSSEHYNFPVNDLLESIFLGGAFLGLAALLLKLRGGSYLESLSVPMSRGEITFVIILGIFAISMLNSFQPEPEEGDFQFRQQSVLSDGRVQIAYLEETYRQDAEKLLQAVSPAIRAFEDLIPIHTDKFSVRIALSVVLKPSEAIVNLSSKKQGILISANFQPDERWSNELFTSALIHSVLASLTEGRVALEPNHALLDGFSLWWATQYTSASATSIETVDSFMLQALYAHSIIPLSTVMLREWEPSSDDLGDVLAMTLAYSGWKFLAQEYGLEIARELAYREFTRPVSENVKDWYADWRHPFPERFKEVTGADWASFVSAWQSYLEEISMQQAYVEALKSIPEIFTKTETGIASNGVRQISYTIDSKPALAGTCTAIHGSLPPFDVWGSAIAVRKEDIPGNYKEKINYEVMGAYGSGTRVFTAIECEIPPFPHPVRLNQTRLEIE